MRWVLRKVDHPAVAAMQRQLRNLPEPLARVLVLRGIHSFETARAYFRDSRSDLHDPFLMDGMGVAARRLVQAIEKQERVLVYGDYDADGVTATALVTQFLRGNGVEAHYFIPSRFADGYGLHSRGIGHAASLGATLVVAVDCGATALDEARYTRECGMDLLICDHHTPGPEDPPAVAVLNPKRATCAYPCMQLTAAGIAYKLVQAVLQRLGRPNEESYAYLDLAAISTTCDIVPLVGENRILVREGLTELRRARRPGLRALAEISGCDLPTMSTSDIGFRLGPRINAAGRLAEASRAVELLLSEDAATALSLAQELDHLNRKRRELGAAVFEDAQSKVEIRQQAAPDPVIVLHSTDWHQGVLGIAASRIKDRFNRPTILLSTARGEIAGSARSIAGINILQAISACSDLLTRYGGHAGAAGLTLPEANIDTFRSRLNTVIREKLSPQVVTDALSVDARLDLLTVNQRFVNVLRQFAPFGQYNEEPLFLAEDLEVAQKPRTVGSAGQHLKIIVQPRGTTTGYEAIGFNLGKKASTLDAAWRGGMPIEAVFALQENTFRGRTRTQLRLSDIRIPSES